MKKNREFEGKNPLERALISLINDEKIKKAKFVFKDVQKIIIYINDKLIFKEIMKNAKFKKAGSIYDYPKTLPKPDTLYLDNVMNLKKYQKLAVSNKYQTLMFYTIDKYSIQCTFITNVKKLKKFSTKLNSVMSQDSGTNIFRDTKFVNDAAKYTEISDSSENGEYTKLVDVITKNISPEHLVFDKHSSINDVMTDIKSFFTTETYNLYNKLEIPYKRGIILHGNPGNGKSAMIRQIIRTLPDVAKVVINPNVSHNITKVLKSLTKTLGGKKAIIVIEDIDSLITDGNRSDFLNILDGVELTSGLYFIGTTNYPEKIDPAFMNRSGRFDKTYAIEDPNINMRELFFKDKNVDKLFKGYKVLDDDNYITSDREAEIIKLFVDNSENLPMASLKELITSSAYLLASKSCDTIEEAIKSSYNSITNARIAHSQLHDEENMNKYKRKKRLMGGPSDQLGFF